MTDVMQQVKNLNNVVVLYKRIIAKKDASINKAIVKNIFFLFLLLVAFSLF